MVNITDSMSVQFIFLMLHNNTAASNRNWIHFLHRIHLYALGSMGSRRIAEFVVEICQVVSPEMFDQKECLIHSNSCRYSPIFKEKAPRSKILASQNALECWGKSAVHEPLTVNVGYRWILGTVGRVVSKLCLEIQGFGFFSMPVLCFSTDLWTCLQLHTWYSTAKPKALSDSFS